MENTVLIIDQDAATRKSVQDLLLPQGYRVTTVGCSEEALRYLESEKAAVVLTALKLGGSDGLEICRVAKKRPFNSIVYAFSSYLKEYDVDQLKLVGFDGHIKKPLNPVVVTTAVKGAFDRLQDIANYSQ
jgi:CheY-like chemotaxis protein